MLGLQITAAGLLALNAFEQGLEIPFSEALGTFTLDDFIKQRGTIFHRLGENLQQIPTIITIHKDV